MLTPAVLFALFLVFLGLTWTLSLAESAFSYLSRRDAEDIVREQPGSKVLEIARERESHLGALRVWRFVAEALSAVCLTAAADAVVDDTWLAVAIAAVVLVGVAALLGVWSPRPIGSRNEAAVARRLGGLVWVLRRALGPLAARLDRDRRRREVEPEDEDDFQERHLREFVARAHDADVLADSEAELIQSVFSMNDTIVRSVMVPRTDVVTIDADHTLGQAMALFLRSGNSRIPVIGEDADDIRGMLHLKDVTRALHHDGAATDTPVTEVMRDVRFVPESKSVATLLQELQRESTHVAVVVDEYGGTAGLVTLEDLIEEIVGEIYDEDDRPDRPEVEFVAPGVYSVDARMGIHDFREEFELPEEDEDDDVDTVGGLLAKELGRVAIQGSRVVVQGPEPAAPPHSQPDKDDPMTDLVDPARAADGFRSGFVSLVGRPNAGKSTLTNALVGEKVAITSSKPQTTRHTIRGIVHREDFQLVLVDTPGLHRPRTLLGERLNDLVAETLNEVDAVGMCLPADEAIGPGDRFIAQQLSYLHRTPVVAVVTKTDKVGPEQLMAQLVAVTALGDEVLGPENGGEGFAAVVPVSAVAGRQVDDVLGVFAGLLPAGPPLYPDGELTDEPEAIMVAELIREAALEGVRDELPHSVAVVVEEMSLREDRPPDRPLMDVWANVFVERDSQKGIIIGKGGSRLREIGAQARAGIERMLGTKVHLDLRVKVAKEWQRDPKQLGRLGF